MSDPRNFLEWVCDPARTNDELFTVELIIEQMRFALDWPFRKEHEDFDGRLDHMRARAADPAYRPALRRAELELLSDQAAKVNHFSGGSGGIDRPLRDLMALTFFPGIKDVSIGGDISDLSLLASLPDISRLSIGEYGDLAGGYPLRMADCGEMRKLEYLDLNLHHAWPDLRALANCPALREFRFHGNALTCEDIAALPAVRLVELKKGVVSNTPLRDLTKIPLMPVVKHLALEGTESLEGIGRYPSVVNLEIGGGFRDLAPLAALTNVTALTLTGEFFRDLSPLSRLPKLREVRLVRERSIDLTPLTDCPQLRRVEMERCSMMRTEVAALNAGLLPEAADFEAEKPRMVGPLKFFVTSKENEAGKQFFRDRDDAVARERERFFDGDAVFAKAAARFVTARLEKRLDKLLGRGWGLLGDCYVHVTLKRFADTCRTLEVIQLLREESARSRFPLRFLLIVRPHGDMSDDLEDMRARDEEETEPEGDWLARHYDPDADRAENEEFRQLRQQRYEYLKREHLLQLREADGIDPSLLSLPEDKDETTEEAEPEEEPGAPSGSDEDGGTVALAPEPSVSSEVESLGEELEFYLEVHEDCVVANESWVEPARYNLGLTPVEWAPGLVG